MVGFIDTMRSEGHAVESICRVLGEQGCQIAARTYRAWPEPPMCARGCFAADTLTAALTFYENGNFLQEWDAFASFRGVSVGNVTRLAIAKLEPLRVEIEAFLDAILGLTANIITMRQGLRTATVAEACVESANTGTTVAIDAS